MRKIKSVVLTAILILLNLPVQAEYPNFAETYMGHDKFENYNRKMFAFNLGLNKYAIKPIHTVWASILPKYGMDRIQSACKNIEYPKRVISCLIQKDFAASRDETLRFITNTTVGLGGMFDPAKRFLKLEAVDEDIEQALSGCHINSGPFVVLPVLAATSPRNIAGRILDTALNPTTYVATPVLALAKAGITLNKTSYLQPLIKMIESTYADPYDIARKLYGIERHIKCANLDRSGVLDTTIQKINENADEGLTDIVPVNSSISENDFQENINETFTATEILQGNIDNIILRNYNSENSRLMADIILFDYHPQSPVIDAMRTALFDIPEIKKSIWSEFSIWNRSFCNRIKTSSITITPQRDKYKFKYILQHSKTAPIAIIYPSIGEGITSYHSTVLAKLFYDAGYSVIIQGSHFQWEYIKSMPEDYRPGIPSVDADYLKIVTSKILTYLQLRYNLQYGEKVLLGTSFGALTTLFIADKEAQNNTLGITKYISICPPVELVYAMEQFDKNTYNWNEQTLTDLKNRVAITAAKIVQLYNGKKEDIKFLPFSDDEAKLITGFVMHQKLSDLIYTLENTSHCQNCNDIYKTINNMTYHDYTKKYLLSAEYPNINDLREITSLHSIADYLANNNNYKIYHAVNDYLTNEKQLKQLKQYSGNKTVLLNNGSHLGFLYRQEFIDDLKKTIALGTK